MIETREQAEVIASYWRNPGCVVCGKQFTAKRRHAMYCGTICRQKAWRWRKEKGPPTTREQKVFLAGERTLGAMLKRYKGCEEIPIDEVEAAFDACYKRLDELERGV